MINAMSADIYAEVKIRLTLIFMNNDFNLIFLDNDFNYFFCPFVKKIYWRLFLHISLWSNINPTMSATKLFGSEMTPPPLPSPQWAI